MYVDGSESDSMEVDKAVILLCNLARTKKHQFEETSLLIEGTYS
jgi:hypothetical protein